MMLLERYRSEIGTVAAAFFMCMAIGLIDNLGQHRAALYLALMYGWIFSPLWRYARRLDAERAHLYGETKG